MSALPTERDPVEQLAEEFTRRRRRGEAPSVDEYVARHPELADQIREVFQALVMIEDLAPVPGELTGPLVPRDVEPSAIPQRLGEYRLLREIGRGGMGVVFEAVQESLGRHVALKVLPFQALLQPTDLDRFRREAKAAARLHHTNIVPVFGVGEANGIHFFAMQYIQGQGLDVVLRQLRRLRNPGVAPTAEEDTPANTRSMALGLVSGRFEVEPLPETGGPPPQPPAPERPAVGSSASESTHGDRQYFRGVAQLGAQVADALAYAHKQGILHRDIKPSNLLLDQYGTVWVTDFGLAKSNDGQDITHTGDVVGTLRYMPPERFRGWSDPRSDVYSLGLTIYEMLTLRPAFEDSVKGGLIDSVLHHNPPPPRRLDPNIPHDLETIVLKAIDKEPARRYQTAQEMAEDLRRYLVDKPIQARRAGAWERLRKWVKRRPAAAALILTVLLASVSLLAMGAWSYASIERALGDARQGREEAVAAREKEEKARLTAEQSLAETKEARTALEKAKDEADNARAEAEKARIDAEKHRDEALAQAYRALLNETRGLGLTREPGWRNKALTNVRQLSSMTVPGRDRAALRAQAVSAVLQIDAREALVLKGHDEVVASLDFSADGKTLATADYLGSIRLWDVSKGQALREITGGTLVPVNRRGAREFGRPVVRFHPRGGQLAYTASDHSVLIAALDPGGKLPTRIAPPPGLARPLSLSFDRQGNAFAVGWSDGNVGIHDPATGTLRRTLYTQPDAFQVGPELLGAFALGTQPRLSALGSLAPWLRAVRPSLTFRPDNAFLPLALSPDGSQIAVAGVSDVVEIRAVAGDAAPALLKGHRGGIRQLAFSADGQTVVTASRDFSARLWDAKTGQELHVLLGHTGNVFGVCFSPDGTMVATVSDDRTARVWDAKTGQLRLTLRPRIGFPYSAAFSPDGGRLAIASQTVTVYELQGTVEKRELPGHHAPIADLVFGKGQPQMVTGSLDGRIHEWDLGAGKRLAEFRTQRVASLALSPDGRWLAAGTFSRPGTQAPIILWDRRSGEKKVWPSRTTIVYSAAFDPDGKHLATSESDGGISLWSIPDAKLIRHWRSVGGRGLSMTFLEKGNRLLTGSRQRKLVLLDVGTGQVVREHPTLEFPAQVAVSPRLDRAVVLGTEGTLELFSLPDLERLTQARGVHLTGTTLAFSPDGALFASGGRDRLIHLWSAESCKKLLTLPPMNGEVGKVGFDPGGTHLVSVGAETIVTAIHLPLLRATLKALALDLEAPLPEQPLPKVTVVADAAGPREVLGPPSQAVNAAVLRTQTLRLMGQRKYEEVIPVARQAIQANPEEKELYMMLGQALNRTGRYREAVPMLNEHLKRCVNCPSARRGLAESHYALREFDHSHAFTEELLKTQAPEPYMMVLMANILSLGPAKYRDLPRAKTLAERALAAYPDSKLIRSTLGRVHYRSGDHERAIKELSIAVGETSPEARVSVATDLLFLAMCHQKRNDPTKAREHYDRAIKAEDTLPLKGPEQRAQWKEFRAEAESVLGIKPGKKP